MRFYMKLFAIVLVTASAQKFLFAVERPSELWFGMRCSLAYVIDDKDMINHLVEEIRDVKYAEEMRSNASGG